MPKRNAKQTKPAAANDEAEEYEVECLLEQRASDGKYKVKWLGYAAKDATWEPAENIGSWHLAEFKKRRKKKSVLPTAAAKLPAAKKKIAKKKLAKKQEPAAASGVTSQTNTLLNVPFKEKDAAKKLGAKWDWEKKKWYVPPELSCAKFKKWLPKGAVVSMKSSPAKKNVATSSVAVVVGTDVTLVVPLHEEDAAKAVGAKEWEEPRVRPKETDACLCAPPGLDLTKVAKWLGPQVDIVRLQAEQQTKAGLVAVCAANQTLANSLAEMSWFERGGADLLCQTPTVYLNDHQTITVYSSLPSRNLIDNLHFKLGGSALKQLAKEHSSLARGVAKAKVPITVATAATLGPVSPLAAEDLTDLLTETRNEPPRYYGNCTEFFDDRDQLCPVGACFRLWDYRMQHPVNVNLWCMNMDGEGYSAALHGPNRDVVCWEYSMWNVPTEEVEDVE